jgi:hypothetical protein
MILLDLCLYDVFNFFIWVAGNPPRADKSAVSTINGSYGWSDDFVKSQKKTLQPYCAENY